MRGFILRRRTSPNFNLRELGGVRDTRPRRHRPRESTVRGHDRPSARVLQPLQRPHVGGRGRHREPRGYAQSGVQLGVARARDARRARGVHAHREQVRPRHRECPQPAMRAPHERAEPLAVRVLLQQLAEVADGRHASAQNDAGQQGGQGGRARAGVRDAVDVVEGGVGRGAREGGAQHVVDRS